MQTNIHSNTDVAIYQKLAAAHAIKPSQVQAFAELLDEGASVPFIARYRKELTGGLDDELLRTLEKALIFERDLENRRQKITELLNNQNALNDELKARIAAAASKLELDTIYEPYRPKRKTLATKARLAGLTEFAERILAGEPLTILADYAPVASVTDETGEGFLVDYSTFELQMAGVQAIILDEWATALDLFDQVRTGFNATASLESKLADDNKQESGEKFKDYFEHIEPFAKLSNHRLLAMLRGRQANVLTLNIIGEDTPFIHQIKQHFKIDESNDRGQFLADCAKKLWENKWRGQIEHRLLTERRLIAETHAIDVFAQNLKHLLMAAPAGAKVILGADPGFKNGLKMAVIDPTGNVLDTATVYPFTSGQEGVAQAKATIANLIKKHSVDLVAIGNGTASRESEELIKDIIKTEHLSAQAVVVSEAGASVYSASEIATLELPELDVSLRGAVSIARRLQDPLSELVKVEPKAIGVGQYQHDVNQTELESSLDKVTEDCVNAVGVDVNTASPSVLAYIAGLNKNVAQQIVNYRRANGAFKNREELKAVPRLGVKTFEQAAGFLRIKDGTEPLDATGVHPESYDLVYEILNKAGVTLSELLGNETLAKSLNDSTDNFSQKATVLTELAKPAHDPRGEFITAKFREDVNHIKDLAVGMVLEGVVSNVTAFGCFVDIGVHQDGLVHISELADHFVLNPTDVVKPQDIVKVRVLSVDESRKRISLSMKSEQSTQNKQDKAQNPNKTEPSDNLSRQSKTNTSHPKNKTTKLGSLGALLQQAGLKNP